MWIANFTHQNGEEMRFGFDNYQHTGASVAWSAGRIGVSELAREIELINDPNVFLFMHYQDSILPGRGYSRLVDTQNGLRLYSITWQELIEYWGFIVSVRVSCEKPENEAEILERTKGFVRDLSDHVTQDNIDIELIVWNHNVRRFSYCRQSDTFIDFAERRVRP